MDLTPYFEKFNEIQNMPHSLKLIILIIVVSSVIIGIISEKMNTSAIQLPISRFESVIIMGTVIIVFIVTGMRVYNQNFVVQPFIKETRVAINEELNTKLTKQQVEDLLEDQPTWANHITKSEIEERN